MMNTVSDTPETQAKTLVYAEPAPGGGLTLDEFREVFRNYPSGVALVTATDGTRLAALTATSVCSISAEPPLILFSLANQSSASPVICAAETVVIHLLTADQLHLAKLGATSGIDRFADESLWERLPTGEPVFHGPETWVRARVLNLLSAGSSTVVLVHALESSAAAPGESEAPLVYHNRTWHALGDASRLAD